MQTQEHQLLLVTCLSCLSTLIAGIRVDWGTNTGPIVPPTPRTTARPQQPYREPAPVWEDQSDDIPNPNPYVYVPPPPSRPRTWPISPNDEQNNYGKIITGEQGFGNQQVAALAAKYTPGIGFQYVAVVPNDGYYYADKLQGKYNAKTKKYKAYEKAKLGSQYNYHQFMKAIKAQQEQQLQLQQQQQQQLPMENAAADFHGTTAKPTPSSSTTTPSTTAEASAPTSAITSTTHPTKPASYKLWLQKSKYYMDAGFKKHQQLIGNKLSSSSNNLS